MLNDIIIASLLLASVLMLVVVFALTVEVAGLVIDAIRDFRRGRQG